MRGKELIALSCCGLAAATVAGVWVSGGGGAEPTRAVALQMPEESTGLERARTPRILPPTTPAPVEAPVRTEREPAPAGEVEGRPERAGREGQWDREEVMRRFDTDGDGELSESEREAMREQFRERRGQRGDPVLREALLRRYDADGDGELNEAEREVARAEFRQIRQEIQDRIVPLYDLDGDGRLNREERQAAAPAFRAEFQRLRAMAVIDQDGSGDISEVELARAIAAVSEGDQLMDLNGDGVIDHRDAIYAAEVATQGN
jgi:Ca2+-binding EF-hand superfamily protein